MEWKQALTDFRVHLKLERALSERTVDAYLRDVGKLRNEQELIQQVLNIFSTQ